MGDNRVTKPGKELDYRKLREDLMNVYETYLVTPTDTALREKARKLYGDFMHAAPMLSKDVQVAVNLIVDVGFYLPSPAKPSEERIRNILRGLREWKI